MLETGTFVRKSATLTKGTMEYLVAGEGPDVICLHGAAGLEIRAVARQLRQKFRVWLPIVPGYESTAVVDGINTIPGVAGLLAEFIDQLIGKPCEVVGHSMGARIAAWLAILHPEKIEQLVLMAPAGFRPVDAPPLAFEGRNFVKQMYAHPERRPPEMRSNDQIEANRKAMRHYGVGGPRDEALIARIGEIAAYTLILGGSKDERVPAQAVQLVKSKIKRSQLLYVYDAAHAMESDQPERVANLVEDFFLRGDAFIVNAGVARQTAAA
ncbi:MAG: alpha/beta fold hydrolase [Burkholderiales bacterium]